MPRSYRKLKETLTLNIESSKLRSFSVTYAQAFRSLSKQTTLAPHI